LSVLHLTQKAGIETIMKIEIHRVSINSLMSLKLAYRGWRQINAHLYASSRFSSHRVSFEQLFTTPAGTLTR